jgi:FkbM family methyltransferase
MLQLAPDSLALRLWFRFYRDQQANWAHLYESAPLRYAPNVSMQLLPGDHISDMIAFTGFYEPTLTRRIAKLARRGGLLIDVGANIGYYSLLWASLNKRNKTIAFEASPRNINLLQKNIHLNGLDGQIEVVSSAAGKESGRLQFAVGPSEQTGWGGFAADADDSTIDVDVVRIDEIVSPERVIDLLKVDIEGADTWAIMGCERLLKAKAIREVWFEQNKPRIRKLGIPLDAAQNFLQSVGYSTRCHGRATDEVVEWSALPET